MIETLWRSMREAAPKNAILQIVASKKVEKMEGLKNNWKLHPTRRRLSSWMRLQPSSSQVQVHHLPYLRRLPCLPQLLLYRVQRTTLRRRWLLQPRRLMQFAWHWWKKRSRDKAVKKCTEEPPGAIKLVDRVRKCEEMCRRLKAVVCKSSF